jgi:hypothetical protein
LAHGWWQTGSTLQQVGFSHPQAGFGQHTGLGGHGLQTGAGFGQQTGLGGHGGGHGFSHTGFGQQTGFGAHGFGQTGPLSQHVFSHVMWMWMWVQQIFSLILRSRQQSLVSQQPTDACPQQPPPLPPA